MTGPVLAGRTPGLHLDERGEKQATAVAERIGVLPVHTIVSSPLDRCLDTAGYIARGQKTEPAFEVDRRLIECDYGDWTGKPLKDLTKDPVWKVVQQQPSAARFPAGESLSEVSARAVAAVRDWNAHVVNAMSNPPTATTFPGAGAIALRSSHRRFIITSLPQTFHVAIEPLSVSFHHCVCAGPRIDGGRPSRCVASVSNCESTACGTK